MNLLYDMNGPDQLIISQKELKKYFELSYAMQKH
jgi:hypothetical protein